MTNKTIHYKFFINALRTSLIFIAGFFIYELLKAIEAEWNKTHPNNELTHFAKRKTYHFIAILIIDLLILYSFLWLFDIEL
jgi:hypothetical protein